MAQHTPTLRHEPDAGRFVADLDDGQAVLEYTRSADGTLDYRHTFVPERLRGHGLASALVAFALDHALEHGLTVRPTCPFVATYLDRHPQYRAVDARYR